MGANTHTMSLNHITNNSLYRAYLVMELLAQPANVSSPSARIGVL